MRVAVLIIFVSIASCAKPKDPQQQFWDALSSHCGKTFEGSIVRNEPSSANDPFADKKLVMQVRDCSPSRIAIPFHVGADHSRTWILTKTSTSIRLEHDHRHEDGTPDAVTMYGGDTLFAGTSTRQQFPASARSKALFERENLKASVTNVWAMEVGAGNFAYELKRPGRAFRVSFDLTPR